MTSTLEQRISALSDDELNRLLTVDADQYRPEALEFALAEAERRHLDIEPPEGQPADGSGIGTALGAFAKGVASEFAAGRFSVEGRGVTCTHCGGDSVKLQPAVVNTRALTFFGLDWLNRGASVLACEACGLLIWFRRTPDRIRE